MTVKEKEKIKTKPGLPPVTLDEIVMCSVIGHAYTDDHWLIVCPRCGYEMEFQGFFDSEDKYDCDKCRLIFLCKRIVFEDDSYIT